VVITTGHGSNCTILSCEQRTSYTIGTFKPGNPVFSGTVVRGSGQNNNFKLDPLIYAGHANAQLASASMDF
jgi:hypothetical protein